MEYWLLATLHFCEQCPLRTPKNMWQWLYRGLEDPDARKDWGQEEKGTTEDEMVGWHHRFNGHGFEWTLGVGDGQGGLACCGSWGRKELDTTEWLNWIELRSLTLVKTVMIELLLWIWVHSFLQKGEHWEKVGYTFMFELLLIISSNFSATFNVPHRLRDINLCAYV